MWWGHFQELFFLIFFGIKFYKMPESKEVYICIKFTKNYRNNIAQNFRQCFRMQYIISVTYKNIMTFEYINDLVFIIFMLMKHSDPNIKVTLKEFCINQMIISKRTNFWQNTRLQIGDLLSVWRESKLLLAWLVLYNIRSVLPTYLSII